MKAVSLLFVPLLLLAACSPAGAPLAPAETSVVQMSSETRARMDSVNEARFTYAMPAQLEEGAAATPQTIAAAPGPAEGASAATPAADVTYDAGLVRIQVLLDRAHFSPGVIDGYDGENVRKAVSEYQQANNLAVTGVADETLLQRLEQADAEPALVSYVVAEADTRGPFVSVPQDLEEMSALDHVGYERVTEALAEKFHMDEDLLRTLNPNVAFNAGDEIVVANAGGELSTAVANIEVDKSSGAVRAFDAQNQLIAYYPATIGSSDAPAPTGDYEVRAIAFDPTYHYDPERLPTFGERDHGALTIQAGPNNPVGAVWIALSLDTYGIHGAPNPSQVSKTASHGCVRLTNWDAIELGRAVRAGVPVRFREATQVASR